MHDPNAGQLLAQADSTAAGHNGGATGQATGAQEQPKETGKIFTDLLSELGDHRELSVGPWHICELPVILIDNGLHVYPSVEEMEREGQYTYREHHIYRAGTEQQPSFDFSITSLVVFQWLAMLVVMLIFIPLARKYKKHGVRPVKGFLNAAEAVVIYVQNEIVLPNVGEAGRPLMPIFLTFFFFILVMNLFGLVPGGHSATGSLNVTAALAGIAFFVIQGAAIWRNGFGSWLKHLTGGVHWSLWPVMVPVEILGLFTKPFALCVRLFANMTAGHVIILSLIGLTFVTTIFIPVSLGFSLFINILELLVAFIQAYIFTMLTAVFAGIGMASHDHGHDQPHGEVEHAAAH
jgi:F-type H+-transporting ATPase subunit a